MDRAASPQHDDARVGPRAIGPRGFELFFVDRVLAPCPQHNVFFWVALEHCVPSLPVAVPKLFTPYQSSHRAGDDLVHVSPSRWPNPDDGVSTTLDKVADHRLVAAAHNPTIVSSTQALAQDATKLISRQGRPIRLVVERVELNVFSAQNLGETSGRR